MNAEAARFLVLCDSCGQPLEPGRAMEHRCPGKFAPRLPLDGELILTPAARPKTLHLTARELTAKLQAGEVLATIVETLCDQNALPADHEARRWVQRWHRAE